MDRFAVLSPFVGVLVGLGVADLVFSVHRTVRAGRRWHWVPAVWVASVFLVALAYWWVFSEIGRSAALGQLPRFVFHLVSPLLLVLTCAAALPDDGDDRDLWPYYLANHRYFFALYAAFLFHATLDYGFNYGSWSRATPWFTLGLSTAAASLAVVEHEGYHKVMSAVLLAALVAGLLTFVPTL